MPLRVLVAPDKFKGTLTAEQAAGAIVNGWWSARPQDDVEMLPMSDGGEGFGAIVGPLAGALEQTVSTVDAAGQPREARWWWNPESRLAIVESAEAVGLALLPPSRHHPFDLDSRGLAAIILAAIAAGAESLIVGVGGTATNDGGFGLAAGLGWKFLDGADNPIARWADCSRLVRWTPPESGARFGECTVAVDVENPLLGINGCSRIYGPQKGLIAQQAPIAEMALEKLATLAREQAGYDLSEDAGCGAGGGLGFGMRVFLGARIESGFDIFARLSGIDERIAKADLVITGEGHIDKQSLMGKGTGRLAARCESLRKPCIALAGQSDVPAYTASSRRFFRRVWAMAPGLTSPAEARKNAAVWLERLAHKAGLEQQEI